MKNNNTNFWLLFASLMTLLTVGCIMEHKETVPVIDTTKIDSATIITETTTLVEDTVAE